MFKRLNDVHGLQTMSRDDWSVQMCFKKSPTAFSMLTCQNCWSQGDSFGKSLSVTFTAVMENSCAITKKTKTIALDIASDS